MPPWHQAIATRHLGSQADSHNSKGENKSRSMTIPAAQQAVDRGEPVSFFVDPQTVHRERTSVRDTSRSARRLSGGFLAETSLPLVAHHGSPGIALTFAETLCLHGNV